MKRIISFMLIITMCLSMWACSGEEKQPSEEKKESTKTATPLPTAEPIGGDNNEDSNKPQIEVTRSDGEYEYNQELNIIDDNYRNYYQVFVYSFCDSDGSGIGDINGVISKLDYIKDMGFNGIWLLPVHPSTTYHKYNVRDYMAIDETYGTLEDFKRLIEECHKRDIKLIMDFVINHSGSDHEWFKSACKSVKIEPCGKETCTVEELCREHNPYVDYYIFTQTKSSGDYKGIGDGWYYEGVFDTKMPDLNLKNENLRKELEGIMKYWLDMGVDGFRLDAAMHFVEKDTAANNEIISWVTKYCKSINKDAYIVAEVFTNFTEFSQYYESGIDSIFNFSIGQVTGRISQTFNNYSDRYSLSAFGQSLVEYETDISAINPNAIDAPFITNHDMARLKGYMRVSPSEGGVEGAYNKQKMANAMLYVIKGSPFMYYGEEIGMASIMGKDENFRAPMYWSNTNSKGMVKFSSCDVKLTDHTYGSVEEQMADKYSLLNFVKRCVQIRNENPEIARGTTAVLEEFNKGDIMAISKEYNGSKIIILMNISGEHAQMDISKSVYGYEGIRGYASCDDAVVTLEGETLTLPNNTMVVLK
ncbi:MAG: alpha amylase [Lachnospiraceae bacterium]|nr:alpha amylase [Lachnospiraceae bacterium]